MSGWRGASERAGRQRGVTLVELLVATTILAIAITIALVLYDGARRSFKLGENLSEQQQAVRIAFDLVSTDIRSAGFNINPDGSRTRPDEAIEGAFDTAIVVRADFDAADPVDSLDPETSLAGTGSAFLSVPTGNDEIRAYVLAKPGGGSSDTLSFEADVGQSVRDGTVENVDIGGVALTLGDPPYNLYRITLAPDASPQRTVLIENVRSMRLRYLDRAGNPVAAPGGSDDEAELEARDSIRRVELELEALTRDPDPQWIDAKDPDPDTRRYRKFRLEGDITPRNLGLMGIKDLQADTTPPSAPAQPNLWPGHCGGLLIDWTPNPPQDETAYYRIRFGTSPSNLDAQRATDTTHYFISDLADGTQYYVTIEAIDAAGNASSPSPSASATTQDTTVPRTPVGLTATTDRNGEVYLAWTEVTENVGNTNGDPRSPMIRDLAGYRLYRSENPTFSPALSNRIANETAITALPAPEYTDDQVANCRNYYYRLTGVDRCGVESAPTAATPGSAWSDVPPERPVDVIAFDSFADNIRLKWTPVHLDTDGNDIFVPNYNVFHTGQVAVGVPPLVPDDFHYLKTVDAASGGGTLINQPLDAGKTVWYYVTALDSCTPPNVSTPSDPASPDCSFSGEVVFLSPDPLDHVWGDVFVRVVVSLGSGSYLRARLRFTRASDGAYTETTIEQTGFPWDYVWHTSSPLLPEGIYRITAEVDQQNGGSVCTDSASRWVWIHRP